VERIFVHPAIKKTLCEWAGNDRDWLSKIRPWWGHHYHFHIRIACPTDSPGCISQHPVGPGDGCGREVESWLTEMRKPPEPPKTPQKKKKAKPKPELTLADLPNACSAIVGDIPVSDAVPVPIQAVPIPDQRPPEPARKAASR